MGFNDWTDLLPMGQSNINQSPSPQRGGIAPVTALSGLEKSGPINNFLRSSTQHVVKVSEAVRKGAVNIAKLQKQMAELHPLTQADMIKNREQSRQSLQKGNVADFVEGQFVLVARKHFQKGQKLALRWRRPRRIVKATYDFAFLVEALRNGKIGEIQGTHLKV